MRRSVASAEQRVSGNGLEIRHARHLHLPTQEGYELDLVLYDYDRSIFKGEGENSDFEVQLQADGSYKFVVPEEELTKSNPSITVFYKKIGTDINYDVNGDGIISIADVTKLVNVILGKE